MIILALVVFLHSMISLPPPDAVDEKPGRRVVALNLDAGRMFIGWRYRESDGQRATYEVKRADKKTGPYTMAGIFREADGTNFIDSTTVTGNTYYCYVTTPTGISRTLEIKPSKSGAPCLDIPVLPGPPIRKIALGDLTGDGYFEIVICRQDDDMVVRGTGTGDGGRPGRAASPERRPFHVEAYSLEGGMLWRSALEISAGEGVSVVVWDLDGDGLDEVVVREGSDLAAGRARTLVLDPVDGSPRSGEIRPQSLPATLQGKGPEKQKAGPLELFWNENDRREIIEDGRIVCVESRKVLGSFRGDPVCIADILGDWREELITWDGSLIRVYTTTIPTAARRPSLMDDPRYRFHAARASGDCLRPVESPAWRDRR